MFKLCSATQVLHFALLLCNSAFNLHIGQGWEWISLYASR